MNRKKGLRYGLIAMSVFGAGAIIYPFLASLSPSAKAINDSVVIIDAPPLEPGIVYSEDINGTPLFLLKPTQAQRSSIELLNAHVWTPTINTYNPKLGAYVYWGFSPKWGCPLEHKPPQQSRLQEWNKDAKWLGGYWDNWCEVSYDYSGRAIKTYNRTYNGYTWNQKNLKTPSVLYKSHGKLYVSISQR
jgi:Rieske Fe-S protein